MSKGLNEVRLFGHVGADPELKITQGGTAVLKIRVATTESFKNKSGEWEERTEWHSVVVFAKRAEGLGKILHKGSQVLVLGSLKTSSYEGKDGVKRYKTEIVASDVLLGGSRGNAAKSASSDDEEPTSAVDSEPDIDSLPF